VTEHDINRNISKALDTELGLDFCFFKTSDRATGGLPDFALIGHNKYSGWEVKHEDAKGGFKLPPLQLLTCQRLDRVSFCRYLIFTEIPYKDICIVIPKNMQKNKIYIVDDTIESWDYKTLARYMKEQHL
jgi:hypothetical protein